MILRALYRFADGSKIEQRSGFGVHRTYLVEADGAERKIDLHEERRIYQERSASRPEREAAMTRVRAYVGGQSFHETYPQTDGTCVDQFRADLRILIPGVA